MDLLFILLVPYFACSGTSALNPPKYLWPLGKDSFTYDVVNNEIGIFPNITDCFPVGPKHPKLSYSSLYFDRNSTPHVDVRIPLNSTMPEFTLSFYVYPLDSTGIIFHYVSDNTREQLPWQMYMAINNGKVHAAVLPFTSVESDDKTVGQYSAYVLANEWTLVALSLGINSNEVKRLNLFITGPKQSRLTEQHLALELPGTLRFGDGQSPLLPREPFLGFITAAALYDTVDMLEMTYGTPFVFYEAYINESDVLQDAKKSNWPSTPSIPSCPYRVQYGIVINHLWPLDEKGLTRDIRANTGTENSQCLRFGQIHPTLPNRAVFIDGSSLSSIHLPITGTEVDESFTLTVSVLILNDSSGSLMKIVTILGQTLFEIVITETELQFNAFTNTGTHCASLTLADSFTTNTWYVIGIYRDVESKTTGMIIDGTFNSTNDTCGIIGIAGDLLVQIGASSRYLPGYRGAVRCLILFNNPGSDIIDAIQNACTDANAFTTAGPTISCIRPNLNIRYHVLYKRNVMLPASLPPLDTYITKSLISCAISCQGHVFCRSFIYVGNKCLVYDLVTESGLISTPESVYYILEN